MFLCCSLLLQRPTFLKGHHQPISAKSTVSLNAIHCLLFWNNDLQANLSKINLQTSINQTDSNFRISLLKVQSCTVSPQSLGEQVLQLEPQVRKSRRFAGIRWLKWEAAVFCNRQRMDSYDGAVLLYDGPEHWGEVELGGQHSHHRLVGRLAEALPRHKGETCRRAES